MKVGDKCVLVFIGARLGFGTQKMVLAVDHDACIGDVIRHAHKIIVSIPWYSSSTPIDGEVRSIEIEDGFLQTMEVYVDLRKERAAADRTLCRLKPFYDPAVHEAMERLQNVDDDDE